MGLSVIIPVKGRSNHLEKLLKSIMEAKKCAFEPIEVIVIDSSDKVMQLEIKKLCNMFQAKYYYLQKGVSDARNCGINIAGYSIIFFVDSDCEVDPNIFNEHLKCYKNKNVGGCAGLTEFVGERTWLWNVIEKMPFLLPFQWAKSKSCVLWAPCSNISFRKDILEMVNGFESMLPPKESGEDVDLGYRVTSLGYKISCNSDAIVYHTRETWIKISQLIERTFRYGRGEYCLMEKHPQNTFLDIPKTSIILFIILIPFVYKTVTGNILLCTVIPIIWLLVVFFVQSMFFLEYHHMEYRKKELIYIYFSLLLDFIFELGTIFESIKKCNFKLLFHRFIYIEDQLIGRWHWGIIRIWSLIISSIALFVVFAVLDRYLMPL